MRVRIDPGHGGVDPGAVGNGVREAECVLEVSKLIAAMLRAHGVGIDLTRTSDTGMTSAERAEAVSQPDTDCVVSVHANAAADPAANGYEIFVSAFKAESRRLGELIAEEYGDRVYGIGPREPEVKTRLAVGGKADYYYVVRHPTRAGIPAVMVELGFVSNARDASLLASFWGRFAMAYGVARGVLRWLGVPIDAAATKGGADI